MAESYISEVGDKLSHGVANTDGSRVKIIAPKLYTDGNSHPSIATALAGKAPVASPALTGTPTAPTAAAGTNTTQIATTAFVNTAISNGQYIIPDAYCDTAAGTAAKTAKCAGFALASHQKIPFRIQFTNNNSSAGQLTLSVNGTTAKNLFINGSNSSSSNYTINAGIYWCVYDGTQYLLTTDKSFGGAFIARDGTIQAPREAYLNWGGRNITSAYSPIDAAMVSDLGANRLMFGNGAGVTVEYTRDGGTTWTDYGLATIDRSAIFSVGYSIRIGKSDSTNNAIKVGTDNYKNYKVRVTITTNSFGVYSQLNKFVIYCSTSGSQGSKVTLTARTKANKDAGNDTWTNCGSMTLGGWPGYNVLNTSNITTYGNQNSQFQELRFLFEDTVAPTNTESEQYLGLAISRIMGFGGVGWICPSNMARNGHLYTYNAWQDAVFPATITATKFIGPLQGNADTATTADSLHTYSLGVSDSKPWRKVLSVTGLGTWNSAAVVLRVFNRGYAVQSNLATYYGTVVFRIYRGNDTDSYPTYRDLFVDNGMFADPSISGWNACIVWTSTNDAELWLHCNANSSSVCYAVEYSNNCTVGDPIGNALSSSEMTTYLSGKSYKNPTYSVAYNGTYQYMTVGNATTATKLGSSTLGSGTKPIYLSSGTATECSTYAGGTAVTLNNASKAASTASFYAPTAGGTANYVLIGNGTTSAPTWAEKAPKASAADTATKATQDSDGNAINATYFKSSGNVTLVSNTATKIGTQNGADVKLTLPSIPAAVSVKGNAESSYRTGQVNLTPANLGISATTSSVTVGSTTFNNTDTKVTQTTTDTSSNAQYRLLMSATADDTTRTEGARKSTYAWFNPSTQTLGSQKFNVAGAAVIEYSSTTDTVDIKFN